MGSLYRLAGGRPGRNGEQRDANRRTTSTEKVKIHSHQSFPFLIPSNIPSRAREPALAEALGSLGASLVAKIGPDKARSWFKDAEVIDIDAATVTLRLPNSFLAAKVRSDFEPDLLVCCSALVPTIKAIKIVVATEAAA